MDLEPEVWKPVVGFEAYYSISSHGRVRRDIGGQGSKAGKILKFRKHPKGYRMVSLCADGKVSSFLVHQLVAKAFLPPRPGCDKVNHKGADGDKANNYFGNLEWSTDAENKDHCLHVLKRNRKLSDDDVAAIRKRYVSERVTQAQLGKEYGVSQNQISLVVMGKCWGGVGEAVKRRSEPVLVEQIGEEEWREVPSFRRYSISNYGRLRRDAKSRGAVVGKILTPHDDGHGYLSVRIRGNFGMETVKIHLLVAAAFLGPSQGRIVNHKNTNRADPRLNNLEYIDGLNNARHGAGYDPVAGG